MMRSAGPAPAAARGLGMAGSSGSGLAPSSVARLSSPTPVSSSSFSRERSFVSSGVQGLLVHVQRKAQAHLSSAISSERARRWGEAVDHYRKLLRSLMRTQLPESFIPGPDYMQLLLETYYHIGVAFQKLDRHPKALEEFTNAIEVSHIPKYACQVGCASKSFYHTPVYARRAYANIKCGKNKDAMYDANRAVTLDISNPDVYCIRALVWSSANENRRALVDLNHSLKLNSSHVCTLILRGAILEFIGATSAERNKDHEKVNFVLQELMALKLCQDSRQFFDVLSFHSPKMPAFFDRFLWSLNAFHTITVINLFEGAVFAFGGDFSKSKSRIESPTVLSSYLPMLLASKNQLYTGRNQMYMNQANLDTFKRNLTKMSLKTEWQLYTEWMIQSLPREAFGSSEIM